MRHPETEGTVRTAAEVSRPSDDNLMQAIRGGDAQALQLLIDRYWASLVRYAARSLGHRDDAEDVAQEAFVRLWQRREAWTGARSVRGYLHKVVRNAVIDEARRTAVRERSVGVLRQMMGRATNPLEEAIRDELRTDFEKALVSLPSRRQEAFLLVRLQGLSLKEAADIMDVTPRTVANHVYLAVTDLAEALYEHVSFRHGYAARARSPERSS